MSKTVRIKGKARTKCEAVKMVLASQALAEEIKNCGEIEQPLLLSMVLGLMTLQEFDGSIKCLTKTALVEQRGNVLKWKGSQASN